MIESKDHRTDFKPEKTAAVEDREARLNFKVVVHALDGGCLVHDDPAECDGDFAAHHVTTRQHLRKAGLDAESWNPANGMTVCDLAHRRHHAATQRIPLARVPQRARDFAERFGFDLSTYYATSDADQR